MDWEPEPDTTAEPDTVCVAPETELVSEPVAEPCPKTCPDPDAEAVELVGAITPSPDPEAVDKLDSVITAWEPE